MNSRKNFLPQHPKIIKKVNNYQQNSPSLTLRSNDTHLLDTSRSMDSPESQSLMQTIMEKQNQLVQQLEQSIKQKANQNYLLEQSLKYYDHESEMQQFREKIEEEKQEQVELIKKIQNCEKVEQTTTPEQYYLWQKKKKTDEFNRKIEEAFQENHEQRNNLQELCGEYKEQIEEERREIGQILEQLDRLKNGKDNSDIYTQIPQIDEEQFFAIKQEYQNLSSTIELMKESNHILSSQLDESLQSKAKSLKSSFSNYKSTMVKDLNHIKRQIQSSEPIPPASNDRETKSIELIAEYEGKMKSIKQEVPEEQVQDIIDIITPFDWSSLKWEQYVGEPETIKETQGAAEQYENTQKEVAKVEQSIKKVQDQLRVVMGETMQCQQKKMEIQSAINKILRLSMSMSGK